MSKRIALFLFLALPVLAADRYIVVLSTEPMSTHVGRSTRGISHESSLQSLHSPEAETHRARIHSEQAAARTQIEQQEGTVLGSMDTLLNAMFVEIDASKAAALAQVPGVLRVYKSRHFIANLDAAAVVHSLPQAWATVGGMNKAGAGVKIAIIDSGIQTTLPGFQDTSLTMPAGFPKVNAVTDTQYTNTKVIVARSYASLFDFRDPDRSARDRQGHGTAVATCAAAVQVQGAAATISGFAPKAWLGNYKVTGSPGVNDGPSEAAALMAIEDAANDGMDIVNLSFGVPAPELFLSTEDPFDIAIEAASSMGVLVVASAGNDGPGTQTIGNVSDTVSALSVGATENSRTFANSVKLPSGKAYLGYPGDQTSPGPALTAPIVDIASINGDGTGCKSLPAGSLTGKIGLFARTTNCFLRDAMSAAQAAGGVGVIIYTDASRPAIGLFTAGTATIPGELISNADGLDLKTQIAANPNVQVTINLTNSSFPTNSNQVADFSSAGPTIEYRIKPEIAAVGDNVYMQAQTLDSGGDLYDKSGFALAGGTSFSSPMVAGAAAVVKSFRPGLTNQQYRSLLINSATSFTQSDGTVPRVMQIGGGLLNVNNALTATAAVTPQTVSFGAGTAGINSSQTLTISNVGASADMFQLSVTPRGGGVGPQVSPSSVTIPGGGSATVTVTFSNTLLQPGQYEGYLHIASASNVDVRVPYWYGVASPNAASIIDLGSDQSDTAGGVALIAIVFRVLDASGIMLTNLPDLNVTAVSGGGKVLRSGSIDGLYPGAFGVTVLMGPTAVDNVFQVTAGGLTQTFTITGF